MLAVVAIASTVMLNGCCQQEQKSAMIEFPEPAPGRSTRRLGVEMRSDRHGTYRRDRIGYAW